VVVCELVSAPPVLVRVNATVPTTRPAAATAAKATTTYVRVRELIFSTIASGGSL
jgi:hypothetical protein